MSTNYSDLTDEQRQRAAAVRTAREALIGRGGFAAVDGPDSIDIINVASWIVTGLDPWLSDEDRARQDKATETMRDAMSFLREMQDRDAPAEVHVAEPVERATSGTPPNLDDAAPKNPVEEIIDKAVEAYATVDDLGHRERITAVVDVVARELDPFQEGENRVANKIGRRVDAIIAGNDNEQQHSDEDKLLHDIVMAYAPAEIRSHIERLDAAPFARWCA